MQASDGRRPLLAGSGHPPLSVAARGQPAYALPPRCVYRLSFCQYLDAASDLVLHALEERACDVCRAVVKRHTMQHGRKSGIPNHTLFASRQIGAKSSRLLPGGDLLRVIVPRRRSTQRAARANRGRFRQPEIHLAANHPACECGVRRYRRFGSSCTCGTASIMTELEPITRLTTPSTRPPMASALATESAAPTATGIPSSIPSRRAPALFKGPATLFAGLTAGSSLGSRSQNRQRVASQSALRLQTP